MESRLIDYFHGGGPIADSLRASTEVEGREADVAEARGVLDKIMANTRLLATLGEDEYETLIANAKRNLETAIADLAEVRNAAEAITGIDGSLLASWPTLEVADKRRVFATLLERVELIRRRKVAPFGVRIVWRAGMIVTETEDGFVYAPESPALAD